MRNAQGQRGMQLQKLKPLKVEGTSSTGPEAICHIHTSLGFVFSLAFVVLVAMLQLADCQKQTVHAEKAFAHYLILLVACAVPPETPSTTKLDSCSLF